LILVAIKIKKKLLSGSKIIKRIQFVPAFCIIKRIEQEFAFRKKQALAWHDFLLSNYGTS
jgi:hypothetical protein